MARTAIKKPARSPSTSRSASPILTPPSPDPNNDDGGALLYDIVQAFQKHGLTDTPEPASNTDTKVKNKKTRRSKAKKAAAQKDNPTVDNPKAGKTKVKEVKATSTELIQKPTQPLTVKRTTIIDAFNDYFGEVSQLANWQRLCADLDIEPMPTSITQCKKALKSVWVNIYDFLDAKAAGVPVKRFPSERALAKYTMTSGKVFPKKNAKKGGPARVLLAHIFHH